MFLYRHIYFIHMYRGVWYEGARFINYLIVEFELVWLYLTFIYFTILSSFCSSSVFLNVRLNKCYWEWVGGGGGGLYVIQHPVRATKLLTPAQYSRARIVSALWSMNAWNETSLTLCVVAVYSLEKDCDALFHIVTIPSDDIIVR